MRILFEKVIVCKTFQNIMEARKLYFSMLFQLFKSCFTL